MSSIIVVESHGSSIVSAGSVSVRSTKAGRPNGSNQDRLYYDRTGTFELGIAGWIASLYTS